MGRATETDGFSEKFQAALPLPPPSFRNIKLQFFFPKKPLKACRLP